MEFAHWVLIVVVALILGRWAAELLLDQANRRHVLQHAGQVPPQFREIIDAPTYKRSVEYTLARNRFGQWELTWSTAVLLALLLSGLLPWLYAQFQHLFAPGVWTSSLYLLAVGLLLAAIHWPWEWHAQFHLEEAFGFNTSTPRTWWLDRLKSILLMTLLGLPLLALILKLVDWAGSLWWIYAWAAVMLFNLLMVVIAPILILPLFNKLTPLPPGSLRDQLLQLAEQAGFEARSILLMDGSRRSKHSNAFFTGFGRFRKIVLFDTLVEQLTEPQLAAVLAHEIGHYKKKHIPKMLCISAATLLLSLFLIHWMTLQPVFYRAFGFSPEAGLAPALLLFGLLSGSLSFWWSPLMNRLSRRYEYQADAYAASLMQDPDSLIHALRELNRNNLSNLTPHPTYSQFHYSHPTLIERETALRHH